MQTSWKDPLEQNSILITLLLIRACNETGRRLPLRRTTVQLESGAASRMPRTQRGSCRIALRAAGCGLRSLPRSLQTPNDVGRAAATGRPCRHRQGPACVPLPRRSALALNWSRHAVSRASSECTRRDRSTRHRPCNSPRAPPRGGCERTGAGAFRRWRDAYRTMDMGARNSRRCRRCSVRARRAAADGCAPSVAARGVLRLRIQLTEILVLARVFLACCLYTVLVRT